MAMPPYLYHATTKDNAPGISKTGLEPRSVGGKEAGKYLCMAGAESKASTLGRAATDVIFRLKTTGLDESKWRQIGPNQEWRCDEAVSPDLLEYRRNLGSAIQKSWRPNNVFPRGLDGKN
jgi:hypothetical protein